jgi:hypothetical protein
MARVSLAVKLLSCSQPFRKIENRQSIAPLQDRLVLSLHDPSAVDSYFRTRRNHWRLCNVRMAR